MNIILSTYFTTKKDPQRKKDYHAVDDCNKTRAWITSLSKLKLNGIIFYDNLSEQFVSEQSNEYVQFVKYVLKTEWSLNDERYLCYKEFLDTNPQYTQIFMTDLFDVTFHKSPFELFKYNYKLYIGDTKHGWSLSNHARLQKRFRHVNYAVEPYLHRLTANAGVFGGERTNVLLFLAQLLAEFVAVNTYSQRYNINMPVFNKVLFDTFEEAALLIGEPVTSAFRRKQKTGNFAIRHK